MTSRVILHSFYKIITLIIVKLKFWIGQIIYERGTIRIYKLFLAWLYWWALGLFDRTCTADTRKKYPGLYHSREFFNHREF